MPNANPKIRFCTSTDNVRIAFTSVGNGPPVVKTANWLTHIEFDAVSPVWSHWIRELSRGRTLTWYDVRGCGLSDWEVTDLSFEGWVRDLETVVDAAGLDRFALVGLSQGGAVSIAYATRHPQRVSHLVLCGAFARGRLLYAKSQSERDEYEMAIRLAELGWDRDNPAFRQTFAAQLVPEGNLDQHRSVTEMMRLSTSARNAGLILRQVANLDVTALAPKVRCPTLVLHSRHDARIPFDEGRLVAALIPDARFVPLDGCNHILLENESGWATFQDELRTFLPAAQERTKLAEPFDQLSARELEVLDFIARGLDNKQIADRLSRSEKTVRNHITTIFFKLDVRNRSQAIVQARAAGFGLDAHGQDRA